MCAGRRGEEHLPGPTAWNLVLSAMCSAPGMPPGTAMRSQSLGAPRPAMSFTSTSATMRTPREHTTSLCEGRADIAHHVVRRTFNPFLLIERHPITWLELRGTLDVA